MDDTILTTRTLSFLDSNAEPREVILTIFKPVQNEYSQWKVAYLLGPPFWPKVRHGTSDNIPIAFTYALWIVSAYLRGTQYYGHIHWQGNIDCGLPDSAFRPASWLAPEIPPPEPNSGDLEVFSSSMLSYPDKAGAVSTLPFTVFMPKQIEDGRWKCGITFGPSQSSAVYYGVGDDFIEAFLDAAAMARVIYDSKLPAGWKPEEGTGCEYLPYKIGRSYYLDERGGKDERDASGAAPGTPA